jgi:hypothetical protein
MIKILPIVAVDDPMRVIMIKKKIYKINEVFVTGGLPTVTYVDRHKLGLEKKLQRALAKPNQFTSITGTSKSGKTVLLRSFLDEENYVGVDGGQVKDIQTLWQTAADRLSQPMALTTITETSTGTQKTAKLGGSAKLPYLLDIKIGADIGSSGSEKISTSRQNSVDLQNACGRFLIKNDIILVIDDFHYIRREEQTEIVRNLKNFVFDGLKVVLLSVPYKAYEAIQAEVEITGRFVHVNVPDWDEADLQEIGAKGFKALNVDFPSEIIRRFAQESNGSPQLMQSFCWEACVTLEIAETKRLTRIPSDWDPSEVFEMIAADAGQPIYDKLASGPQKRSDRIPRPLKNGQNVDIYQALLYAIAQTGPKRSLTYNEIRSSLSQVLAEKIPSKLEVSNTLNHLAKISRTVSEDSRPMDWVEDELRLELPDPMFRFFLKWYLTR